MKSLLSKEEKKKQLTITCCKLNDTYASFSLVPVGSRPCNTGRQGPMESYDGGLEEDRPGNALEEA